MSWPSKRSGINLHFPFDQGMMIDHCNYGGCSPFGTSYDAGAMYNRDVVDPITLIPSDTSVKDRFIGFFYSKFPASSNFTGPYVLWWAGNLEVQILSGTWTVNAGLSSNYTEVSNGRYHGTNSRIVVSLTDHAGGDLAARIIAMDKDSVGAMPTEWHCYRLEDEADFLAGKYYRTAHLQHYVDENLGYIRHMNSLYVNGSMQCRYRHRNKPEQQCFGSENFLACDTYGEITGTNQYAIADTDDSPVAMEHGEVVQGRVTNGMVRSGGKTVTAITRGANGRVTATAHGFNTSDIVKHEIAAGMVELNNVPCTITVIDVDTYDTNVNTTAFTAFTAGRVNQYITLNRGGLGAYPVVFINGTVPASEYGNDYIQAADYKYFVFHKKLVASTTITGAWIFSNLGASSVRLGIPVELIAKFHAELDALQVAQSTAARPLGPTDCYVNIPGMGLCSIDDDYDEDDAFGIQAVEVLTNGNGSWPAVPSRCAIIVGDDNESWNAGGDTFGQTYLKGRLGQIRWGGGASDYGSYHALHSCVLSRDLRAAFPAEFASGRLKYVMEGQGTLGISGINQTRINGGATLDGDALFITLGGGDPIDYHDGFAYASYFVAEDAFDTANLTDLAAEYADATTDAARETVCSTYVDGVIGTTTGETIGRYRDVLLPAYADEMHTHGKIAMQYEGGWDHSVTNGTDEVDAFMVAVKKSRAWARALQYYFRGWIAQSGNANVATTAYYPADYIMLDARWGHAYPDTYLDGVEGAGLDAAWVLIGKNNNGIYSFEGSA